MKEDIKNNKRQEHQTYVPASVKVIEVAAQRVICLSGGTYNKPFGDYDPEEI